MNASGSSQSWHVDRDNLLIRTQGGAPVLFASFTRDPLGAANVVELLEHVVACVNVGRSVPADILRRVVLQFNPNEEGGNGKQKVDLEPGAASGDAARSLPDDIHAMVDQVLARHGIGGAR